MAATVCVNSNNLCQYRSLLCQGVEQKDFRQRKVQFIVSTSTEMSCLASCVRISIL